MGQRAEQGDGRKEGGRGMRRRRARKRGWDGKNEGEGDRKKEGGAGV